MDCCALTLAPFTLPVCTPEGVVFDLPHILPHLEQDSRNPVTGAPLNPSSLIRLTYAHSPSGQLQCPITLKAFTDVSHVVANRKTGQVYSLEGLERLNGPDGQYRDLFTEESFGRADLVTLQDPAQLEGRNMAVFLHVQEAQRAAGALKTERAHDVGNVRRDGTTGTILTSLQGIHPLALSLPSEGGKGASPPTPTTSVTSAITRKAPLGDEETAMFSAIRHQGKATLRTNLGDLHVEVYCSKVPRTAYNFLQLARRGFYAGVAFHRLVPGFVVQGGDPSGTGAGGASCFSEGLPFANEFAPGLSHNARGVLSMANKAGRLKSNTSQFFITFTPQPHLDRSHPVFGRVIGGWETLDRIEGLGADEQGRPQRPIVIEDVIVVEDPFEEYRHKQLSREASKATRTSTDPTLALRRAKASINSTTTIGKYLKRST